MTPSSWVLVSLAGFAGVYFLCASLHYRRKQRLLHDLPTSKTKGVFIGTVELKGTAECTAPLTSFLATQSCVHYAWQVQERWTRTVSSTDSKGRSTTRRESGWDTVAKGGEHTLFYLKDDTGVVPVHPDKAEIEPAPFFSKTVGRDDPLYYGSGPATTVSGSDHRRLFTEQGIPLHAEVYVVGQARERKDIVGAEIAADPHAPLFMISTRGEAKVQRTFAAWSWFFFVAGLILVGVAYYNLLGQSRVAHPYWPAEVIAGYLALWALGWVWMVFNSLVNLRQRVRQGYSLIEVELKRRHDLIPPLVASVSALSTHETDAQTAVSALRSQLAATPAGKSGPDFSGLAGTLRIVAEKYPQITAQPNFAALQAQLIETEQRIALARTYYNDIATQFRTRLEQLPERFIAPLGAMRPERLFTAGDFERAPITVKLAP